MNIEAITILCYLVYWIACVALGQLMAVWTYGKLTHFWRARQGGPR